jgi:hypothetical protein
VILPRFYVVREQKEKPISLSRNGGDHFSSAEPFNKGISASIILPFRKTRDEMRFSICALKIAWMQ